MAMITPTTRTITNTSGWFAAESDTASPIFCLQQVMSAYVACRKQKRAKVRTCFYEQRLLDNLINTTARLQAHTWQPKPPVVFIVKQPKMREVHAAQFEDRVVHHVLIAYLEPLLEQEFIFDAASNRKNKGTHFAVNRLQHFMRQHSGKGYFLQLDIRNFFNSINHDILLAQLDKKLFKWMRKGKISNALRQELSWLSRIIIQANNTKDAIIRGHEDDFNHIPAHKRLINMPQGQGLPIGNLTSQFFANLYMNELDQFVKHQLKCKHYVRYVDDFVLCHSDKKQLVIWQQKIEAFLDSRLQLTLKQQVVLAFMHNGCDFLGYVVKPYYKLIRKRVIGNFRQKIMALQQAMLVKKQRGCLINVAPALVKQLTQVCASYWGHFGQGDSYQLKGALVQRSLLLPLLFVHSPARDKLIAIYQCHNVLSFSAQWRYFHQFYVKDIHVKQSMVLMMQCGCQVVANLNLQWRFLSPYQHPRLMGLFKFNISMLSLIREQLEAAGQSYVFINEQGQASRRLKRRHVRLIYLARCPKTFAT